MHTAVRFLLLLVALSLPLWLAGVFAPVFEVGALDLPVSAVMFLVPAITAAVLAREGTTGLLRRAITATRPFAWYPAGTILPLLIAVISMGTLWAMGLAEPEPWPLLPMLLGFAVFLIPAAFEELGWAFATDALLPRWGWVITGWALGTVAAVWHLIPLLQAGNSWTWIAVWFASSAAGRAVKVWFYLKTRRGVPVLIGIHAMDNACAAFAPGYNIFPGIAAGAAAVTVLAVVLTVTDRHAVMDGLSTDRCNVSARAGSMLPSREGTP